MLTDRFLQAVEFAVEAHSEDVRKGTTAPYVCHVLQVAGLVLEFGGTEDEAIGGLLHDVAEDAGGEAALARIRDNFGPAVEAIVRENSDSITESKYYKAPWRERKEAYVSGIASKSASALLVSVCDKIHNARSMSNDSLTVGESHWDRFNASKPEILAYYENLVTAFARRVDGNPRLRLPVELLSREVALLKTFEPK